VALVALFNLAHTWRYPIQFLNDRAISAGGRQFCLIFATKLVVMATSLKLSKKVGLIICHSISPIWCKDCENRSSRFWDTSAPSERVRYRTKLVVMAAFLEILKKNSTSIIYTQKAFIWCKNCKNRSRFVFCLRHKIGCHGNVPWGIGKNGPDQDNSRKYLLFDEKIVIIGPVDTEIALLRVKKKKKLRKVKYIARSASLPSGLNLGY